MAINVRPSGAGPSMLRINGQEITTRPTTPIEAPKPAGGAGTTRPVVGRGDTSPLQEQMYDAAHMSAIIGQNAAAMIQGKKRPSTRPLQPKRRSGAEQVDHRRIDGVFSEDDPSSQQEPAYQIAAEFEEEVKAMDLSFKRKAAQVEVSQEIFRVDLDDGAGAMVVGESTAEVDVSGFSRRVAREEEETASTQLPGTERRAPEPLLAEETIPHVEVHMSETGLRRALGLAKK